MTPTDVRTVIACLPLSCARGENISAIVKNATRAADAVKALCAVQPDVKIVVLPQYALTGGFGSVPGPTDASVTLTALQTVAKSANIYIAFADRFEQGLRGVVFDPTGALALTQEVITGGEGEAKVHALTTPHGVMSCLVGEDANYAEYARLAVFAGAEIILHPTAEMRDERSQARHLLRGARSWENHVVLACASFGDLLDAQGQKQEGASAVGFGEIRDYTGALLASGVGEPVSATIDIASLRRRRSEPWVNFPAQLRTGLYGPFYRRAAQERSASQQKFTTPTMEPQTGPAYDVLLMQTHQIFVSDLASRESVIQQNMNAALSLAKMFAMKPSTRLVVFPEFFLQGTSFGDLDFWEKAGIRIPGPETEQLGNFAKACNVYVCGAVLEYDPDWPRRFFNTSIIISPKGEVILRYRKLQCADLNGILNVTTPGNIYSEYVKKYGMDGLIPVVETDIGVLGTAICFDSNWPELWRTLALKGAEVICNPTSEIHSDRVPYWWAAKRAHAAENSYYIACANAGSEQFRAGAPVTGMNRGHSSLIDYNGALAAHADGPGIVPISGQIDLGALRRARGSQRDNLLARFRPEAVAEAYANFPGFPLDCFLDKPMERAAEGPPLVQAQIMRLKAAGVYKAA
jgi:predicted amidohydrolase